MVGHFSICEKNSSIKCLISGYSCVLSRLEVPTEEWKFDMKSPAEVTLEAKWNDGSQRVEPASVAVPFHFATVVFEEEVSLLFFFSIFLLELSNICLKYLSTQILEL